MITLPVFLFQVMVFASIYFAGYYWRWPVAGIWIAITTLTVLTVSTMVLIQFGTIAWAFTAASNVNRPARPLWKARLVLPPHPPQWYGTGKVATWTSTLEIRKELRFVNVWSNYGFHKVVARKWIPCLGETASTFDAWCRVRAKVAAMLDGNIASIPRNKRWTPTALRLYVSRKLVLSQDLEKRMRNHFLQN